MGVRKSHGKNKKSRRPAAAAEAKRTETLRRVVKDAGKPRPQGMR